MIINKTNTNYTFTIMTFHRDGDWNKHEVTIGFNDEADGIDTGEIIYHWWNDYINHPETQKQTPVDFFCMGCDALKFHQSVRVEDDIDNWNPINVKLLDKIEETQASNGYGS